MRILFDQDTPAPAPSKSFATCPFTTCHTRAERASTTTSEITAHIRHRSGADREGYSGVNAQRSADQSAQPFDARFQGAGVPGSYVLLLRLIGATELTVGRLGRFVLPVGWYVYVGSALGGLGPRLRRHLRREKVRHWHIDALREVADLVAVAYRIGPERLECSVAMGLATREGANRPVPRFGASDCRCPTHLVHFDAEPDLCIGPGWVLTRLTVQEQRGQRRGP